MNRWILVSFAALAGACASVDSTATVYRCEGTDGSRYYGNQMLPGARCQVVPIDAARPATAPATAAAAQAMPGPPTTEAAPVGSAPTGSGPVGPGQGPSAQGGSAPPGSVPDPRRGSLDPRASLSPGALPPAAAAYDFIDERRNLLEFRHGAALTALGRKWADPRPQPIIVAHFGDSHIQNGFAVEAARRRLQQIKGDAGRGMLFPYAIARTYSQNDYTSSYEGSWTSANSIEPTPKLPVGVSGFVARTADTRSAFTISFRQPPSPGPKRVKVFLRTASSGWRLTALSAGRRVSVDLAASPEAGPPFVEFTLAELGSSLRFELGGTPETAGAFELHGLSIENDTPGVLYHNLGVGGATFGALLAQRHFAEQFRALAPDLVVLDWGTNDIAYRNQVPERHGELVESTIRAIRAVSPQTTIVLTSVQDMNYRGRNVSAAAEYATLMRTLAFRNDCLFYDWFRVSGGPDAMRYWFANALASNDQLHLTARGYQLKGDLFARALVGALERHLLGDGTEGLQLDPPEARSLRPLPVSFERGSPMLNSARKVQARAATPARLRAADRPAARAAARGHPAKSSRPNKPAKPARRPARAPI